MKDSTNAPSSQPQADAPKRSTLASALAGSLAGSLISGCVQPLDVIRTKMQGDAALGIHRSAVGTFAAVVQAGGVSALWRGTTPSVIRVGLGAGLHFMLLEQIKAAIMAWREPGSSSKLSALEAAAAGGFSRAIATALLCPITVVKTRMEYLRSPSASQAVTSGVTATYKNTAHALWTIGRHEGLRGLFQGLMPTILANAPFSGFYYMFYSEMRYRLSSDERNQTLVNFTSGCVAAVAASLLTQPADVLRTRMQLGLAAGDGSMAVLGSIVRKQGMSALLTGLGPRILKRTSQTALVWTLYEELLPRITSLSHTLSTRLLTSEQAQQASSTADTTAQGSKAKKRPPLSSVVQPLAIDSGDATRTGKS